MSRRSHRKWTSSSRRAAIRYLWNGKRIFNDPSRHKIGATFKPLIPPSTGFKTARRLTPRNIITHKKTIQSIEKSKLAPSTRFNVALKTTTSRHASRKIVRGARATTVGPDPGPGIRILALECRTSSVVFVVAAVFVYGRYAVSFLRGRVRRRKRVYDPQPEGSGASWYVGPLTPRVVRSPRPADVSFLRIPVLVRLSSLCHPVFVTSSFRIGCRFRVIGMMRNLCIWLDMWNVLMSHFGIKAFKITDLCCWNIIWNSIKVWFDQ